MFYACICFLLNENVSRNTSKCRFQMKWALSIVVYFLSQGIFLFWLCIGKMKAMVTIIILNMSWRQTSLLLCVYRLAIYAKLTWEMIMSNVLTKFLITKTWSIAKLTHVSMEFSFTRCLLFIIDFVSKHALPTQNHGLLN